MSVRHSAGFAGTHAVFFDRYDQTGSDRPTVVMVHGGSHTGACWQTTADGRPGWAPRFVERGYPVALPDWPGHGRSGALHSDAVTGELVTDGIAELLDTIDGPVILVTHSMGGALGWRLAEKRADQIAAIVGVAPGPPGNIQCEGRIVDQTDTEYFVDDGMRTVPILRSGYALPNSDFIIKKLVGGSRRFPRDFIEAYARTLTPNSSRLHFERLNTNGAQIRVADPGRLAGKPMLILTGSDDLDHPREIDEVIADWFRKAGALAEYVWLPDQGISGNGHMLMLEENSDEIADLVLDWLDDRFAV